VAQFVDFGKEGGRGLRFGIGVVLWSVDCSLAMRSQLINFALILCDLFVDGFQTVLPFVQAVLVSVELQKWHQGVMLAAQGIELLLNETHSCHFSLRLLGGYCIVFGLT
jgi:hypothetical protein